jgi:hypothetical protein
MEKSVNDRQLHMRILKFTQIGSCVDDDDFFTNISNSNNTSSWKSVHLIGDSNSMLNIPQSDRLTVC